MDKGASHSWKAYSEIHILILTIIGPPLEYMDLIRSKIIIPTIVRLHRQIKINSSPLLKFKNMQTITWLIGSTENQRMRYSQFSLEVVERRQRRYRRRQRKKRVRVGITAATGLLQDSLLALWQAGLSKIRTMSQV